MDYELPREKPIPGRAWPVGRNALDAALSRAGARPKLVAYSHTPEDLWSNGSFAPVAAATYFAEGARQGSAGSVYVYMYSVPSRVRAPLQHATTLWAALQGLVAWVRAASEETEGWRMFDHSLRIEAREGEEVAIEVRED